MCLQTFQHHNKIKKIEKEQFQKKIFIRVYLTDWQQLPTKICISTSLICTEKCTISWKWYISAALIAISLTNIDAMLFVKDFFSICIFNDWCQVLCLQFALQILRIIQIKLGYKNIWISCRRLCHSNLEINIDSLIQILHCDWSLCCIRRSATKYLCFDTKDFFAHTNSKFALWIMFNSK